MTGIPHYWWPTAILAAALFGDALMSIRPPQFIRGCLEGVRLPEDWWWVLIVVKLLALVALWWCFVRDARLEVDAQDMSRQLAPNPVVQGAPRGQ